MKSFLKKDLFNKKSIVENTDEMCEFVDPEGNFIDDKEPNHTNDEIYAPDQTMDQTVQQTRQPGRQLGFINSINPPLREEEGVQPVTNINDISANVMSDLNALVASINDNNLGRQEKMNILKYLFKTLGVNGQ